ncbi:MAG: hypothetical protein ABIJ48_12365 [Actinomycetota bacterium]
MTDADPTIARAIASLRVSDPDMATDAEGALEWLTAGEGPAVLTQERLQYFLWYQLPMKWLTDNAHHCRVAAALAEALDLLGLPRYAAICRCDTTTGVLDAYRRSNARGKAAFRRADLASGISPPDVPELRWGAVMGLEEARALSSAADFLELAVAAGEMVPGRPGWKARQQEMVRAHLAVPRLELGGRSYLDAVGAERLEDWLSLRCRSRVWQELLTDLAPRLALPTELPPGTADPIPPLRWLLDRLAGGQALTQTGNLNRAFVQEASTHFGWWDTSLFGPPYREDELFDLCQTHDLAEQLKALRRRGKSLTLSPRGRALLADPEALWRAAARALLPQNPFHAAAGEVTLAVLAVGATEREDSLDARVQAAIAEQGWRDRRTGAPADDQSIDIARHATTNLLRALNLTESHGRWPDSTVRLTAVGRATALEALHDRATGPRSYAR